MLTAKLVLTDVNDVEVTTGWGVQLHVERRGEWVWYQKTVRLGEDGEMSDVLMVADTIVDGVGKDIETKVLDFDDGESFRRAGWEQREYGFCAIFNLRNIPCK